MNKFAIIGCGDVSRYHAECISPTAQLGAVCDSNTEKAEIYAVKYNCKAYSSIDHLLKEETDVDIVIICTPNGLHLPGMVASITPLSVIGVPIKSSNSTEGWDSILSILQMPGGVPVATVALNAAKNAGILAAQIIGTSDEAVSNKITHYKQHLEKEVYEKVQNLQSGNYPNSFDTK